MKTYTTQQARAALGLKSTSTVIRLIRELNLTPVKIPCEFNRQGFVYQLTEDHISAMRARPKPGWKKGRPRK